ncbi:sensor histidine kinase regulating citrate/malate metabolism [Curtobacterium sp. 320]|uniref:ATP-binding protein n=1 Tax=Curtobacterium sp. 320 TaxID=2817749 RepID=UPI00285B3321|nr:ATP-binding protein [Curtobacterium sp. 320]MDR6571613.1 sensor histidine kinase regulating citrate/malate metabolism [Curtobacterium sp. 320]
MAPRRWSIARRLFALQLLFVVVGVAVGGLWSWRSARADLESSAAEKSTAVAVSVARNPFVVDQVTGPDPSRELEPYALDLMRRTHTDFITIMAPDRTRFTHPDPSEIGRPFLGTTAPALAGGTFTETSSGTLGPSVRAVTPITDDDGRVVGLVAAGVTVANITDALVPRLVGVIGLAAVVVAVSALFTWLLSRYLDRVTAGRGPEELARVFASYSGVLHSVHEGLVVVDRSGRIVLHNDRAAELLHLPAPNDHQEPIPVDALDVRDGLRALLRSGDRAVDEVHETADRVLIVNQELAFARTSTKPLGTVTTIRDQTELLHLSGELAATRTLTDALRSQTHEFANRMHAVVALMELGRVDEAIRFASDEIERSADPTAAAVVDAHTADSDPSGSPREVVVALLRGKQAQARERGVDIVVDTGRLADRVPVDQRDVVTVLGNLVDNAIDAVSETCGPGGADEQDTVRRPLVRVTVETTDGTTRVVVADNGSGILDVESAYRRGWSTKAAGPEGRGFGLDLVRSTVARLGGSVAVDTGSGGSTFTIELAPRGARV